ncbi:MAG: hypothetical protein JOZ05_20905 [Acetobacteraceae bacterium]|nr:hypothetical protein [Acetobacteraceae bacterium]
MGDPKDQVAAAYGEGDIKERSMTQAARGEGKRASPAKVPPPDQPVPAAGTTETDVARNLREKAERQSKA